MKPALAFVILVSLAPGAAVQPASAQSFGVKGGANFSTVAVTPPDELGVEVSSKVGIVAGGFLTFWDASRLSVEAAGQLAMRRVAFGPDIEDTITYIEAPAVARYSIVSRPGMKFRGVGGVSFGFRVAASESAGGDSYSVTDAYKSLDIAAVVGAQAEWKRWLFEGRYLYGFSEAYEVTVGGLKTRQRGVQILVGYRLR
jgi:Outer membrane protein beta-barrel domain